MSTFTDDDKAFLRAILSNPAELTGWLVYADWLDERNDPRADFVRLEVRRTDETLGVRERHGVLTALKALRERLDPDWVAIFDRPHIENCNSTFAFQCPKKWESLRATDDTDVRYCEGCNKTVHYCPDIDDARNHARRGDCVAVAVGVPRFPDDLRDPFEYVTMGIMLPDPPPREEEEQVTERTRRRRKRREE